MALSLWVSCHVNIHKKDLNVTRGVWYVYGVRKCRRRWWSLESEKKLLNDINLNVYKYAAMLWWIIIFSSFIYQLHCTFFFSLCLNNSRLTDWLTTGCFLGCHWMIWGADLHSRSVSWHDRFHSECYEWPPSNPGGETWERDTFLVMYISI